MASERVAMPQLFVIRQENISIQGKAYTRLICRNNWDRLRRMLVVSSVAGGPALDGSDNVKTVINARLTDVVTDNAVKIDTSDGKENTVYPESQYEFYASRLSVVQDMLGMTNNFMRMRGKYVRMVENTIAGTQQHVLHGTLSGELTLGETVTGSSSAATGKVVYQSVASGAGYLVVEAETGTFVVTENAAGASESCATLTAINEWDYKYDLDGTHRYYQFAKANAVLEANRVFAVDALPEGGDTMNTYAGQADDTDDQSTFGVVTTVIEDPSIISNQAAINRAADHLEKIKAARFGGKLVAPANVAQEVHDIIRVEDSRLSHDENLRVSGVTRIYQQLSPYSGSAQRGIYMTELTFGGLTRRRPTLSDINDTISNVDITIPKDYGYFPEKLAGEYTLGYRDRGGEFGSGEAGPRGVQVDLSAYKQALSEATGKVTEERAIDIVARTSAAAMAKDPTSPIGKLLSLFDMLKKQREQRFGK